MTPRIRQRGAALLLVLWVVALLTVMAATLLQTVDRATGEARNTLERAQLRALADSALNRTIWELTAANPQRRHPLDGQSRTVEIVGGQASAAVSDEAGRIDLNSASPDLLEELWRICGADGAQREGLMQQLRAIRSTAGPGLLATTDLLEFPGMKPDLFNQLALLVTVYTRAPEPDPRSASPQVRQALASARKVDLSSLPPKSDGSGESQALGGRVLRIDVKATLADGDAIEQIIVLRLTGDPHRAYWLLDSRSG